MHEQLEVWKNYANHKDRRKEMEKTYELQMQSMIHNYSQNQKLEKAVKARLTFQEKIKKENDAKSGLPENSGLTEAAI